ncbi:hypothetical protein BDD12DRAFT_889071 [Trichophaea hybrida]|nr:hypothetical protein BDD12DRAFT_889071 [Trichophaea hybrida]
MPPKKRGNVRGTSSISKGWGAAKRFKGTRATSYRGKGSKKTVAVGRGRPKPKLKVRFRWGAGSGPLQGKGRPQVVDLLYRRARPQPDVTKDKVGDIKFPANEGSFLTLDLTAMMTSNSGILPAIEHMDRVWVEAFFIKGIVESVSTFQYRMLICSGKPTAYKVTFVNSTADDSRPHQDFLTRKGGKDSTDLTSVSGVGAPFEHIVGGYNGLSNSPIDGKLAPGSEVLFDSGKLQHTVVGGKYSSDINIKQLINAWHDVNDWAVKMERAVDVAYMVV